MDEAEKKINNVKLDESKIDQGFQVESKYEDGGNESVNYDTQDENIEPQSDEQHQETNQDLNANKATPAQDHVQETNQESKDEATNPVSETIEMSGLELSKEPAKEEAHTSSSEQPDVLMNEKVPPEELKGDAPKPEHEETKTKAHDPESDKNAIPEESDATLKDSSAELGKTNAKPKESNDSNAKLDAKTESNVNTVPNPNTDSEQSNAQQESSSNGKEIVTRGIETAPNHEPETIMHSIEKTPSNETETVTRDLEKPEVGPKSTSSKWKTVVAGKGFDAIRFLRRGNNNNIPLEWVEFCEENRRQRIDLTRKCNVSLLKKRKVPESNTGDEFDVAERGDEAMFGDANLGDEAVPVAEEEEDEEEDAEALATTILKEIESLRNETRELALEKDIVQERVEEKVEKREKLHAKFSRAATKAKAVAKLRVQERRTREKRIREKSFALKEKLSKAVTKAKAVARLRLAEKRAREERETRIKQNKVKMYNVAVKEARRRRMEKRQVHADVDTKETEDRKLLLLVEALHKLAELNVQLDETQLAFLRDHGSSKPAVVIPVKDPSPLPDYWDGKSNLRGLVYTNDGELCIWQDNPPGIQPKLPKALASKLQSRETDLKHKWLRRKGGSSALIARTRMVHNGHGNLPQLHKLIFNS